MAQERPWRPTDYWRQTAYVPPQTREAARAFEAPNEHSSAERAENPREPERKAHTRMAWNIVALALMCGLVVGVVVTVVAVLALHV